MSEIGQKSTFLAAKLPNNHIIIGFKSRHRLLSVVRLLLWNQSNSDSLSRCPVWRSLMMCGSAMTSASGRSHPELPRIWTQHITTITCVI